jgi:hypothetical protein
MVATLPKSLSSTLAENVKAWPRVSCPLDAQTFGVVVGVDWAHEPPSGSSSQTT